MSQYNTQAGGVEFAEGGAPSELGDLLNKEIAAGPAPVVEAMTRAEIDSQIATAKKYPRSYKKFLDDAMMMATLSEDVAAGCMYSIPRDGKTINGPSVRMAEIVASAWRNIRVDCRIVEIGDTSLVARAVCIDLEANNGQSVEVRVRITNRQNKRYSEDMIGVTAQAAISKARRNAIFSVVPRAFVEPILAEARRVAVGDQKTLAVRRSAMMAHFQSLGILPARVFAAVGVAGEADISLDHLATLRGYATAIKTGEVGIDTVFPDGAPKAEPTTAPTVAAKVEQLRTEAVKKTEAAKAPAPKQPEPIKDDLDFLGDAPFEPTT